MSTEGKVSVEHQGHICLIGLDRAAKRNAFDSHMIQALSEALTAYEANDDLRCAIIFAHGDHFTAGLDLVELQSKLHDGVFHFEPNQVDPWGLMGQRRKKPVIAAIQGLCYTAGIELMLNADVVVAADNAQFTQIEVLRGIMPFGGATVRFVQAAGWQKAMPYLLTGQVFDAKTALDLNLVSFVCDVSNVMSQAMLWAERIAQAAPLAVRAVLKSAREGQESPEQAFANFHQYVQPLFSSEDVQEGVRAMLERRLPQFQGK